MTSENSAPSPLSGASASDNLPLLSVIVSNFNRGDVIDRAIDSILAQTLDNIELIVVDDCSTDNSDEVIRRYTDPRLRYYRLPANSGGPSAPRNKGVEVARAPFIIIFDSDDVMRPTCCERFYEELARDPALGMVWSRRAIYDWPSGTFRSVAFVNPFEKANDYRLIPTMLAWTPGTCCLGYRKEVFDVIGGFDTALSVLVDVEHGIRFARTGRWTVKCIPEVLFDYYVINKPSVSRTVNRKYLASCQRIMERHGDILRKHPKQYGIHAWRLAKAAYDVGDLELARHWGREARKATPRPLKMVSYQLLRELNLEIVYNKLARTKRVLDEWNRKRRFLRETPQSDTKS